MKDYLVKNPWKVIEEGFNPEYNRITESIMSIGNGYMGQRANFEESYSGDSMQGSYLAGIYYPDKTRVGWWKNGYPEYFAKVLNSVSWIGIDIYLGDKKLDLADVTIDSFHRELDMKASLLRKTIDFTTKEGHSFSIDSERFISRDIKELGCIKYTLRSLNYTGAVSLVSYLDFDVHNEDSNYDEQFWEHVSDGYNPSDGTSFVQAFTKKTKFEVRAVVRNNVRFSAGTFTTEGFHGDQKSGERYKLEIQTGQELTLIKKAVVVSSFYHPRENLPEEAAKIHEAVSEKSYDELKEAHVRAWEKLWNESDIEVHGDIEAQQGIRFNIFHLHQTYSGEDDRLNIGPKGFTGEKYGGSTYWDTEAYCIPFYLANSEQYVSRQLLMYRYRHLDKAIENAEKLGFTNGAALYPMVTMNGEECHNEWEITFEEIHRNGAIAYAIFDYTQYTGDESYLYEYGIDVLIGIARFWAQRANWSEAKKQYVILGVTGPNEYENNVNNNWYTNYLAVWCLKYASDCLVKLSERNNQTYTEKINALRIQESEIEEWKKIMAHMYFPYDESRGIFLQQDGFLDKVIKPVNELADGDYPLNQNWSWDRILRSCYIKQADVLQGIYFFENAFDTQTIRKHFEFYEPITVHESSLSPCVHAILACRIGLYDKAYEMYLRTARLDLDDYNNDTEDGLHITSMAGTWMSVVKGFAGMKIENETLSFETYLPAKWDGYSFTVRFRGRHLGIKITKDSVTIENKIGDTIDIMVNGSECTIPGSDYLRIDKNI